MRRREKQLRCSDVGTRRGPVGSRGGLIGGLLPWIVALLMGIAAEAAAETLPTGNSSASSDPPYDCGYLASIPGDPGPDQECQTFGIMDCLGPDIHVTLRVTLNPGDDGTVIFFSGENGTRFWAHDGGAFPRPSHLLQRDLSTGDNDFKMVEVKWHDGWHHGTDGVLQGPARLACRVATIVKKVISDGTYHQQGSPMCATGQSGGANQLAYTLTHYGMEGDYQSVIFTSGPPYSDLEKGCSESCDEEGAPVTSDGCYSVNGRWRIDTAYGQAISPTISEACPDPLPFPYADRESCGEGEFPNSLCINHRHEVDPVNTVFKADLPFSSVALNTSNWDYLYPNLPVFFIFGDDDNGAARFQGKIYRDVLLLDTSNQVTSIDLLDVPHQVNENADGTAEILDEVLASCILPAP